MTGETLLQAVASLGGKRVMQRLRTIQEHLQAERAYAGRVPTASQTRSQA